MKVDANLQWSSQTSYEPPFGSWTFDALEAASNLSSSLVIYDANNQGHELFIYFYHLENWGAWRVNVFARRNEVVYPNGLVPESEPTALLLSRPISFERSTGALKPDGQFIMTRVAVPMWSNGTVSRIEFDFSNLTSTEASSTVSLSQQNGSAIRCRGVASNDFDLDGIDDVATFANGVFTLYLSTRSASPEKIAFGRRGDIALTGDYTGDGRADLVLWRPSNGIWHLCRSESAWNCAEATQFLLGAKGDKPVRGDFYGDGWLDFAVFKPAGLKVYAHLSKTAEIVEVAAPGRNAPLAALNR